MDIFISWSGERSRAVAEALRDWLPMIINAAKPFLSAADIDKGSRWSSEIAVKLQNSRAGIICLTPSNLNSNWILFEAGALSKTLQSTFVCPLLIGLEPADVQGPLAQFQATRATEEDFLKLLKTLNAATGDSALGVDHVEKVFKLLWPQLESQLKNLPPESSKRPHRPDRELLEEILDRIRSLNQSTREPDPAMNPFLGGQRLFQLRNWIENFVSRKEDKIEGMFTLFGTDVNNLLVRTVRGKTLNIPVPHEWSSRAMKDVETALRAAYDIDEPSGPNPA